MEEAELAQKAGEDLGGHHHQDSQAGVNPHPHWLSKGGTYNSDSRCQTGTLGFQVNSWIR